MLPPSAAGNDREDGPHCRKEIQEAPVLRRNAVLHGCVLWQAASSRKTVVSPPDCVAGPPDSCRGPKTWPRRDCSRGVATLRMSGQEDGHLLAPAAREKCPQNKRLSR